MFSMWGNFDSPRNFCGENCRDGWRLKSLKLTTNAMGFSPADAPNIPGVYVGSNAALIYEHYNEYFPLYIEGHQNKQNCKCYPLAALYNRTNNMYNLTIRKVDCVCLTDKQAIDSDDPTFLIPKMEIESTSEVSEGSSSVKALGEAHLDIDSDE